jgi:hypothetical protein
MHGRVHCRDEGAIWQMFKFSVEISWQTPQLIAMVLTDCSVTVFVDEF